jgi:hypothetical protein
MDGGGVTGFEEVSLPLLLHSPIQESWPAPTKCTSHNVD